MARMSCVLVYVLFCVGWFGGSPVVNGGCSLSHIDQIQPDGNPVVVGDSVLLNCRAIHLQPQDGCVIEWARLVFTGSAEETLANNGVVQNSRVAIVLNYRDSSNREEILVIGDVDVQDSGLYFCRLKDANGTVLTARSRSLTVMPRPTAEIPAWTNRSTTAPLPRPTTDMPPSTRPASTPMPTCDDGQSLTPWIASTAALLGLLIPSVIINVYCILKHRKSTDKDETPTPRVEPYIGLQPTGELRSPYMGLTTNGTPAEQHSSALPASEATQHVYYLALSEGNGSLEYDYPRPDDAPNPVQVIQYRNVNN